MVTSISHSVAETERLGEDWGRGASRGWLLGLSGELGAGKTQLVKGLARGLGIRERVHSPTFVLLNEYAGGRLPLFHLDLYRLETPRAICAAGLEEYLVKPEGVTVVEWIEHWVGGSDATANTPAERRCGPGDFPLSSPDPSLLRSPCRLAWLEVLSESQRRISYEDFGA